MKDASMSIIKENVIVHINSMILCGNEYAILNRIAQFVIKNIFQINQLAVKSVHIGDTNDIEYLVSDYHMEFELNEKSLKFIKGIIKNRTISNRNFVFVIKYAEATLNRNLFLELRRLIDLNSTSKFIITATSTSFVEKSLMSRCITVNCMFPFEKVMASDLIPSNIDIDKQQLQKTYIESKANIVSFLQLISLANNTGSHDTKLQWHKHIENLLISLSKETNQFKAIQSIRCTVYKVYHFNIPLKDVCHCVLSSLTTIFDGGDEKITKSSASTKKKSKSTKTTTYTSNVMYEFVRICSMCEHEGQGTKNILSYERLFCEIYKTMLSMSTT